MDMGVATGFLGRFLAERGFEAWGVEKIQTLLVAPQASTRNLSSAGLKSSRPCPAPRSTSCCAEMFWSI